MTKWVTARETVSIVDNQHPNAYVSPLFQMWIDKGWEIVSVMTLPPTSTIHMCVAVGVLRLSDSAGGKDVPGS